MRTLVSGDFHLRLDKPPLRPAEEDWMELQKYSLLALTCEMEDDPELDLIIVGDILHRSRPAFEVIHLFDDIFDSFKKDRMCVLPGNHDLLYHDIKNKDKAGYGGIYRRYHQFIDGQIFPILDGKMLMLTHQLTFPDEKSKPTMSGGKTAQELLDEFPDAQWILVGDYHRAFHYEKDGRHVINPGCMTRQSIDFFDYTPSYYIIDWDTGKVERKPFPDSFPLDMSFIQDSRERDQRLGSFVETVKGGKGIEGLDFEGNLKTLANNKEVPEEVRELMNTVLEEVR
ncbi:MAG: metallophosphoesterase [Desulfobacteraceae bacterium]|jgi:DNA repair exonuclease SbcCD nuclease subunit